MKVVAVSLFFIFSSSVYASETKQQILCSDDLPTVMDAVGDLNIKLYNSTNEPIIVQRKDWLTKRNKKSSYFVEEHGANSLQFIHQQGKHRACVLVKLR